MKIKKQKGIPNNYFPTYLLVGENEYIDRFKINLKKDE